MAAISISGAIVDRSTGKGVGGLRVEVVQDADEHVLGVGVSGDDGAFRVDVEAATESPAHLPRIFVRAWSGESLLSVSPWSQSGPVRVQGQWAVDVAATKMRAQPQAPIVVAKPNVATAAALGALRPGGVVVTPRDPPGGCIMDDARRRTYENLIARDGVRSAMSFDFDGTAFVDYDHWTDDARNQLWTYLCLLEAGRDLPLAGPPPLVMGSFIAASDAWSIYLAHVAQSLWAEANVRTPWRLSDNPEHLAHLFDVRKLMDSGRYGAGGALLYEFSAMGNATQWNPRLSYDWLANEVGLGYNEWSTIQKVVEWCRSNLQHITDYHSDPAGPFATQQDQYRYLYGYPGPPLVERMIHPLAGRQHVTAGCWGTSAFLAAVLRTVNIPVRHGRSTFGSSLHSRPEFFLNEKYLSHGDDPYSRWVLNGHNRVPIDRIFMDPTQIHDLIDAPTPPAGMSVGDAASANAERFQIALAVELKTDYLLWMRCDDVRRGSTEPRYPSTLWSNLHAYYSDDQIRSIGADCDVAIAAIAGGCSAIPTW